MKKSLLSLLSVFLIPLTSAQTADEAVHHLQNKRFDEALKILGGDLDKLATKELGADQLMLLRARAFGYGKQPQKVIETVDEFVAKHPKSRWMDKATFLKAQALADLKKHADASAIYETQAQMLFSPASKNAGALLLMKVAEEFSKEVNPEDVANDDQPKPDLRKADILLKEAYETGCSEELKEEILAKRIKINTRASRWKDVIDLSYLYLQEYDPDWKGKLGSIERLTSVSGINNQAEKNALTGKNRYVVRFHLAEALHRFKHRLLASRYLTELIADLQKANNPAQKNLLADSVWLRLMASRNEGGQPRNVRVWMSDAQQYLKNYPDHIHASNIVYSIGVIYQNVKQYDPAIAAFQDFLNDKYQIKIAENPLTVRAESKLEFNKRLKQANARKEEASYRIGLIHLESKEFDKAKEAWNTTSQAYPNGARWADCQRGLVDIHYQRSLYAVTGIAKASSADDKVKARAAAQQALDQFIAAHPLDKRVPSLLYLIGNIHYIQANEIERTIKNQNAPIDVLQLKKEQAIALKDTLESWEKLITKYPSSSYASEAQYLAATIYENTTGDLEKAITAYKKSSHPNAKNRITALTAKKLVAFSNKNFTTAEKPFVQLSTRNIEKVTVRQYWLDIESYFRKGRKLENISSLDVDLIEADKTWEYTLPKYEKLQLLENKVEIPFPDGKPGICIVKIESKDFSTTTMVMRSDIDIAVRSSGLEIIAYAFDARTNKPASGVKLFIADAGKIIATGKTTEQGYFHLKNKKLRETPEIRVLALSSQGSATCACRLIPKHSINAQVRQEYTGSDLPKAYFNQPKSLYLPGETLPISGIIRHQKDGNFIFPTKDQRAYTLTIRSNQKLLYKAPIQLQDRGIFTHEYTLPDYLPSGSITLSLTPDFDKTAADFTHTVMIKKLTLDYVKLTLDVDKTWINKGDTISGKITAKYRWGAFYANQKISIDLPGNNQQLEVITDAKGEASFSFNPLFHNAGTMLQFSVHTANNRYVSNYRQVLYDPIPFSILAASQHRSMSAGSVSNIEIKTVNPDGKPISKKLNLEVIKIITVEADPILASTRALESVTKKFYKEEVLQTIPLTTDAETGKIIHPLKLDKAGNYQLRVSAQGVSKYERTAIGRSSINVYDSTHSDKIVIQQPATNDAKSGQIATLKTWSSLEKTVPALLTVETNTIIEKRIIELEPGMNSVPIVLDAKHCPSVRVHIMALSDRILSTANQTLYVSNPLTIKSTVVKTTQLPKVEHTIKLQAFDSNGEAVAADVFINLSQKDKPSKYNYAVPYIYNHKTQAFTDPKNAAFKNSSSTGLSHEGSQEAILTSVRDELEKLNRAENDSIQRFSNNPILSQEHVQTVTKVRKLLYRAESYYNQAQFDNAMREYKEILRVDPYNKAARRGMEKVNAAKSDYYRAAYDQSRAQMLMEVDSAWETSVPQSGAQITSGQQMEYMQNKQSSRRGRNYGFPLQDYLGFTAMNTFSTNARFLTRPISPTDHLEKTLPVDGLIWTSVQRIPAEGKEFTIPVILLEKPVHQIQVIGYSDTNASGISSDSINVPLPNMAGQMSLKRLRGLPVSVESNNQFKSGENSFKLTLPDRSSAVDLKIAIATSASEFLSEAVNSDLVSEFGSLTPFHEKHPAGELMAHASQLDYLIHHKLDIGLQDSLKRKINTLCSDLTISQKGDGSWAAVRNRKMNSLLHTAIAYQALCKAKMQGIEIEPSTLIKAKNWLNNQQKSVDTDLYNSRALVQYALAASGDADFATCNRLYRERKKMNNIGKAFLANTFVLLDRKEFTTTLLKEIGDDATLSKPEELYLNSPVLLRVLTFEARNAVEKLTEMDAAFTLLYHSDIDRGASVRAYAQFFKRQKINDQNDEPTISVNGKEVAYKMARARWVKDGKLVSNNIMSEHLIAGENTIHIRSAKPVYISTILSGYGPMKELKPQEKFAIQDRKYYRQNMLYKGSPLRSQGTSETKTLREGETVRVILKGKISDKNHAHSVLIEELPVGFTYLAGSLRGNHSGARKEGNHLVITYSSLPDNYQLSYTLIASEAGTWYHRPTLLSPNYDVNQMTHNTAQELTVLSEVDDGKPAPYQINAAEHYELAKLYFDDKEYAKAKQHIIAYNKLKQSSEDPQLARMLLWIETANETPDAQLLADSFEVLTERAPELIIPFEKILKVGKAYRSIGEHERSTDVYTATLEANFTSESYVSAVLEDQGKFSLSLEYQDNLWLQYPDLGEITTSRFELGQQLYTIATDQKKAAKLGDNPATKKPYTEKELTTLSLDYMQGFLTHAPTHELAADASFSIANALFALKRYQQVVDHTVDAAVTYKDSTHATSFRYMQAVGHYWLRNYDKALAAASKVAQESSDDQELAAFITAQIYHAKGQPENAIAWYESIKNKYPDAAQSIAYFEQKSISLDEVKVLNSGDKAMLKVKFRNIKEAQFQIYRVDLMKLYLREKNLSDISKINLAGINPKHSLTVKLGDGKDFKEKEKSIELPISKDGAYLVICRGDYLYTSGLTLITPLKMEVQEDANAHSVRVNISDKKSGKYLDSVHVKAVGINKAKIVSGDTDLRGVWQGNQVVSPSTIIAKDKKGRYAFFRSKLQFDPKVESKLTNPNSRYDQSKPKVDFNQNLKLKQKILNEGNYKNYEQKRRSKGKGVEIKKARKK